MEMNSKKGLLVSLRSYRHRDGRDSLENFITEAFRWLLDNNSEFASIFIKEILNRLNGKCDFVSIDVSGEEVAWSSQFSLGGGRPDMVAEWSDGILFFEHKVWSDACGNQLRKYRDGAKKHFIHKKSAIIQIVVHQSEFLKDADASLCWHDIYKLITKFLENGNCSELDDAYLRDFQSLLDHEGIGPPAPVSMLALRYYSATAQLPVELQTMYRQLERNADLENLLPGYTLGKNGSRWGRVGFYWNRKKSHLWSPSIGLFTLVNGSDHSVQHRFVDEPLKISVVISFGKSLHGFYRTLNEYSALVNRLQTFADEFQWSFYNHLEDSKEKPNIYHPLYLELPLIDVLRDTKVLQDQVDAIKGCVVPFIKSLYELGELKALQLKIDELISDNALVDQELGAV